MPPVQLFPFAEYWWFYIAFTGVVLVLLAIDLGLFHRVAHKVSFREAGLMCTVWITLSLVFSFLLLQYALWKLPRDPRLAGVAGFDPHAAAWQMFGEFLAGYVTEYSLSVDNIFVFVLIFNYFSVPARYQHRVLFYGILGALVFRGIFIAVGAYLMRFHWVVVVFGVFLIVTGIRMMFGGDEKIEPEKNPIIRLFRRFVPVTPQMHGQKFFVRLAGVRHATPLLITVLVLPLTDILFAVDSVPAIFALTREPLIVFSSSLLAVLGLRSLYFMLAGAMELFHMLKYGLSVVLIFVGLKMTVLDGLSGGKFPIGISLAIICGVIGVSVAVSLLWPKKAEG